MGKIKGKKQSLVNFLKQLVTRVYHQCRFCCTHPALSLSPVIGIERIWLSLIFKIVVAGAGFLSILILINTPLLVMGLSAAQLGTDIPLVPDWTSTLFSILYTFFFLTVCFLFLLALGYVHRNRHEKNFGVSVTFVGIISSAINQEQLIRRSLITLKKIEKYILGYEGSAICVFSTDLLLKLGVFRNRTITENCICPCDHKSRIQVQLCNKSSCLHRCIGSLG